jgi:hypothetical protein
VPQKPASPAAQRRRGMDLETYCLQGLLQSPQALGAANAALNDIGLDPISAADLYNPGHREIFRAWQELLAEGLTPTLEQLAQSVPQQLHTRLRTLFAPQKKTWPPDAQGNSGQDALELRPDEVQEDLLNGLFRLRERNLKQRSLNIHFLLEDADKDTMRLYQRETNDTNAALLRLQQRIRLGAIDAPSARSNSTNQEKTV